MLHELSAEAVVTDKSPDALGLGRPEGDGENHEGRRRRGSCRRDGRARSDVGDGFLYARRMADGALLRLTRDAAGDLLPSPFALRSRKVIDEPVGQAARISIAGPSIRQVLRRSTGGNVDPRGAEVLAVDPGLASDVADTLAHSVRSGGWPSATTSPSASPRLARPTSSLEGRHPRGDRRATQGGVFARRTDAPGVSWLSEPTERALETWAVDRSYTMIAREPFTAFGSIAVATTGRSRPRAPASAMRAPPPSASEIAPEGALEARAEGLVHLGRPRPEEGFDPRRS